jgi:hypothetical protein
MFTYLRTPVVPTAVFAASEDWADGQTEGDLRARIERAAGELADELERRPARRGLTAYRAISVVITSSRYADRAAFPCGSTAGAA